MVKMDSNERMMSSLFDEATDGSVEMFVKKNCHYSDDYDDDDLKMIW